MGGGNNNIDHLTPVKTETGTELGNISAKSYIFQHGAP